MKKVIIAAIALIGISAFSFAQTTPAPKKKETAKTEVAKKPAATPTEKKTAMGGHKKAKAHKKHNS